MMHDEYVSYRMSRANQSLQVAEEILGKGFEEDAINRIYYVVSALLYTKKFFPKTHVGMKVLFNKEFVKNGLITNEQSQIYSTIFAKRFEADYEDFFAIDVTQVTQHLSDAKSFILLIENIINTTTQHD